MKKMPPTNKLLDTNKVVLARLVWSLIRLPVCPAAVVGDTLLNIAPGHGNNL